MINRLNPDCADGKHPACNEDAWDDNTDRPTRCQCACHEPKLAAVTGRPMADYEKYVDLISHVLANGLALAADRDFLLSLDQSLPLAEAVRHHARESIRWRFAFDIDRIADHADGSAV